MAKSLREIVPQRQKVKKMALKPGVGYVRKHRKPRTWYGKGWLVPGKVRWTGKYGD